MRLLILSLLISVQVFGQNSISPLECVNHFYHGVASGDPLSDRVIIWTRITPDDFTSPVIVSYKMATDTAMQNVVKQGSMMTDASKDFTVKFDVSGLNPDQYYYYEFTGLESRSQRGRTKTVPVGDIDSLRFAVVSCANLEAGYFNVYEAIAQRNDFEAVLMLGDYIYEYEEGGYGQDASIDRVFDPTTETISLEDYRMRYSVYHMDKSLNKLHQNFPWICVWDDHESANDSYTDGAENHNGGEGLWSDRKLAAQKAYFEWLPIREKAPNNYEIYREFGYGDLLDLFMVDTRLQGRDQQGVNEEDVNRQMLGQTQYNWLANSMINSSAKWKVLGNQVIMAPITVFGIPINEDAWDGYPAERDRVLDCIKDNSIQNFTVLTGDVHTSWAFNLEQDGTHVGVEFVTPSVTSPGAPINGAEILMIENPHLKFVELTKHGYIMLDANKTRIQGDWFFVNAISTIDPTNFWVKSLYSVDGGMSLNSTTSAALPNEKYDVDLAPLCPRIVEEETNTASVEELSIDIIGVYPNPVQNQLTIHISSSELRANMSLVNQSGEVILQKNLQLNPFNSTLEKVDVSILAAGIYILILETESGTKIQKRLIKD